MKAIVSRELATRSKGTELARMLVIPEMDVCIRLFLDGSFELGGARPGWVQNHYEHPKPEDSEIELSTRLVEKIREIKNLQDVLDQRKSALGVLLDVEIEVESAFPAKV